MNAPREAGRHRCWALQGDAGKPRPALVITADLAGDLDRVALLPLTSFHLDAPLLRVAIEASPQTGLAIRSYAVLDRMTTAPRDKVSRVIGQADEASMSAVNRALAVFLGLA